MANVLQRLIGKPLQIDAFDLLAQLPNESVNLVFCDPPYNIGVFSKMPRAEYLQWCERWIAEASRVLAANGAFWLVHKDPRLLTALSDIVEKYGHNLVNWITWDKYNGAPPADQYVMNKTKLHPQGKRSFDQDAEYLIYHADEGEWTAQCDRKRGFIFEPLRMYLNKERRRAGFNIGEIRDALGFSGNMPFHWFAVGLEKGRKSQWQLPMKEHYESMRKLFNGANHGEFLRREYEDLRREYEDLRYTFNNPGKVSSVWQIPPAPRNGHPTPKPEALLKRIIEVTSNPGDLVLDFFAGSFTMARVAERLNRRWICGDNDRQWVHLGERLLNEARQLDLFRNG